MTSAETDLELKKKINECYVKVLNRPADLDGLQAHLNQIKKGTLTIEQLYLRLKKGKSRRAKYLLYRRITSPFRVLPNFLIIGEHKCGTTSLFAYMLKHPSILAPMIKEPNYFNIHHARGVMWYKSHFVTFFYKLYYQMKTKTKILTGEATTHYLSANNQILFRVKKLLPSTKLIVILRNPIDRAYSQYNMFVSEGREPLSFEDAIEYEQQKENKISKKVKLSENPNLKNSYNYLNRGIYVDNLKRWMEIFPKEQFLILQTEEFNSKPNEVLNRVYKFLDLLPWESNEHKKFNVGHYEKMNPETRKMLVDYFKPHNKRLNEFLGTNFDWDW